MDWRELDDPHNPQNRNAGNGGDLVKHTVYLAVLATLLEREPWRGQLRLRECHAGRGLYRVPADDERGELLRRLHGCSELPLARAQRAVLRRLEIDAAASGAWYAGSTLINNFTLGAASSRHLHDAYEWDPDTRAILALVLDRVARPGSRTRAWGLAGDRFDGESHLGEQVPGFDVADVVLLDPFSVWRRARLQPRRDRVRRIFDGLVAHGQRAPVLVCFFTWSSAELARADMAGTLAPVVNGYQDLLGLLTAAGRRVVVVRWIAGELCFAMWLLAPDQHLDALRTEIALQCRRLVEQLEVSTIRQIEVTDQLSCR